MKDFTILCSLLIVINLLNSIHLQAQEGKNLKYINAESLNLIGKAMEGGKFYHRIDTSEYKNIPASVKRLTTHSAGLALCFITNSTTISAKWCTSSRKASSNNTGIATEGLDLYIKHENIWKFAGVGRPGNNDCNEYNLVTNMDNNTKECLLYLPLVDEIDSLFIGVDEGASITELSNPFRHRILLYGSSIVHGSAPSRPGLAYPAKLSRATGLNFINFGFAGSAKMEKSVADMIASFPVDAFILDCVPNTSPDLITERTAIFVKTVRGLNPGKPIIAIQSIIRESGNFNQEIADHVKNQNENFTWEIKNLQKYDNDLYLITSEGLLGDDHEGTIDGTHPNDLGFDRMVTKLSPIILKILKKYEL